MEIRIVAGDAVSASALVDALIANFGDARVSLRRDRPNAEVRVRGGSDQTVLRVLEEHVARPARVEALAAFLTELLAA